MGLRERSILFQSSQLLLLHTILTAIIRQPLSVSGVWGNVFLRGPPRIITNSGHRFSFASLHYFQKAMVTLPKECLFLQEIDLNFWQYLMRPVLKLQ